MSEEIKLKTNTLNKLVELFKIAVQNRATEDDLIFDGECKGNGMLVKIYIKMEC